jgi:PPOX class probable F420-dependent enzyme
MATIQDPQVRELLEKPNYAVVSTHNRDGSIHSTITWVAAEDGNVTVNSAVGRLWPTNLERDPRVNVLVQEEGNPYHFVEIRGEAQGTTDGADEHIDQLSKKFIGQDQYPYRQPEERRIKFVITPQHVRYVKQS